MAHPSLLQVRDFGEDDRGVFVVTDFIEGPSLRQALAEQRAVRRGRASSALMAQALDAVAALHRRGGFIAGVNPDMIRLAGEDGHERIVMSTAGIRVGAGRAGDDAGAGAARAGGERAGAAVRRARGPDGPRPRPARPTSSRWACWPIRWPPDRLPFRAPSLPELIGQMLRRNPPPPATLNPEVPAAASDAILKCLAGDPAARFQTADEFRQAL